MTRGTAFIFSAAALFSEIMGTGSSVDEEPGKTLCAIVDSCGCFTIGDSIPDGTLLKFGMGLSRCDGALVGGSDPLFPLGGNTVGVEPLCC